jgi:hydrogenase maturation protease
MIRECCQLKNTDAAAPPILVLGLGNILLRDEGVGVHIVRMMQALPLPDGVELWDGGTAGFALLDVLAERRKLIVIDAIDAEQPPGTVMRLTADDLTAQPNLRLSLHEVSFAETLRVARGLGLAPGAVVIFGIQPETTACGLELSPAIARLIPRVIELVLAELAPSDGHCPVPATVCADTAHDQGLVGRPS